VVGGIDAVENAGEITFGVGGVLPVEHGRTGVVDHDGLYSTAPLSCSRRCEIGRHLLKSRSRVPVEWSRDLLPEGPTLDAPAISDNEVPQDLAVIPGFHLPRGTEPLKNLFLGC